MTSNFSEHIGYVGAFLLICRLIPLVHQQLKDEDKINFSFIILEGAACVCLGTSAVMLHAYPFIIANFFSLFNVLLITGIQYYRKKCHRSSPLQIIDV